MKKLILIDPKGILKGFNSGLAYLVSNVNKEVETTIIDLNNNNYDINSFHKDVVSANYIGISIKTSTYSESIKIIKQIRKINEKVKIIIGGAHATIDGLEIMKKYPTIDFCVVGESDLILKDIVSNNLDGINGIIYRKNEKLIVKSGINIVENLDSLNLPNFELFHQKISNYPILTSRGCPYSCTYCSVGKMSVYRWRKRKPDSLIDELKIAKKRYAINSFEIIDDNFTLDINRAKEFCKLLMREGINLKWSCPNGIRADRIDEELIKLMKKSGCGLINVGIESGNEKIFNSIKKGEKLEQVINAVKLISQNKIIVNGFFIIGLKDSNYDIDMESLKFSKKLPLNSSIWNLFVPYPKTEMYNDLIKDNSINWLRDWKEGFHFGDNIKVVFDQKSYPEKEKRKAYYIANLRSKNYGMLATNGSLLSRFIKLIKIVIKYDCLLLPYHLYNSINVYIKIILKK